MFTNTKHTENNVTPIHANSKRKCNKVYRAHIYIQIKLRRLKMSNK